MGRRLLQNPGEEAGVAAVTGVGAAWEWGGAAGGPGAAAGELVVGSFGSIAPRPAVEGGSEASVRAAEGGKRRGR